MDSYETRFLAVRLNVLQLGYRKENALEGHPRTGAAHATNMHGTQPNVQTPPVVVLQDYDVTD